MEEDKKEPAEYVTLVSADGFRFVIARDITSRSSMIRRMLDTRSGFKESITGICYFNDIEGIILEKVCEYLHYHARYEGMTNVPDMDIPAELSLELALAADYLDC